MLPASYPLALGERLRIQLHLRRAELRLLSRGDSQLSSENRQARAAHLDALREYRRAGVFPRNTYRLQRTPVFVDELGTRCAVGHLLHIAGRDDLVKRVVAEANLARVQAMPLQFLDRVPGLSRDELAIIQPTYRFEPEGDLLAEYLAVSAVWWSVMVLGLVVLVWNLRVVSGRALSRWGAPVVALLLVPVLLGAWWKAGLLTQFWWFNRPLLHGAEALLASALSLAPLSLVLVWALFVVVLAQAVFRLQHRHDQDTTSGT